MLRRGPGFGEELTSTLPVKDMKGRAYEYHREYQLIHLKCPSLPCYLALVIALWRNLQIRSWILRPRYQEMCTYVVSDRSHTVDGIPEATQ